MSRAIDEFLDRVMLFAKLPPAKAQAVHAELRDHLLEKQAHLEAAGVPREDAVYRAVKEMGSAHVVGYGLRPRFPFIDVRTRGTARGFIAIGPRAIGVFAFGSVSVGVVSLGALSVGVISMGAGSLGLLLAWGALALSPLGLAYGAIAAGMMAMGAICLGVVTSGQAVAGVWVGGAHKALSMHPVGTLPPVGRLLYLPLVNCKAAGWFVAALGLWFTPLLVLSRLAVFRERKRTKTAAAFDG